MLKKRVFSWVACKFGAFRVSKEFFPTFLTWTFDKKLECWISLSLGNKGHPNVYLRRKKNQIIVKKKGAYNILSYFNPHDIGTLKNPNNLLFNGDGNMRNSRNSLWHSWPQKESQTGAVAAQVSGAREAQVVLGSLVPR